MPEYLTRRELAETLKLSVKTLRRFERDGIGPRPVRLGERIARYPVAEVRAFVASQGLGAPAEIDGSLTNA